MIIINCIVFLVLWFVFGNVINIFHGWITIKSFSKYYSTKKCQDELERDMRICQLEQYGTSYDPTPVDLMINAFLWPRTLYYSCIGHYRIKKSLEKKYAKKKEGD